MDLYIFTEPDGRKNAGGHSDDIIRRSLELYVRDNSLPSQGAQEILRTEAGKPYFRESDLFFSLSHTGSLCACLIGTQRVGLDIQQMRMTRTVSIAERYFSDSEIEYIEKNGNEGFLTYGSGKKLMLNFWERHWQRAYRNTILFMTADCAGASEKEQPVLLLKMLISAAG